MTPQVHAFLLKHRGKVKGRTLDVGAFSHNGCARDVVDITVGVDIKKGKGVDLVCPVEKLLDHFPAGSFDACVSTETLEHVKDWKGFVHTTWDLVKEGGFIVMTMASEMKGRHAYPDDYWRFTEEHIRAIYPSLETFEKLGKPHRYVSIGWVVKKEGELGSLDFEPIKVK